MTVEVQLKECSKEDLLVTLECIQRNFTDNFIALDHAEILMKKREYIFEELQRRGYNIKEYKAYLF